MNPWPSGCFPPPTPPVPQIYEPCVFPFDPSSDRCIAPPTDGALNPDDTTATASSNSSSARRRLQLQALQQLLGPLAPPSPSGPLLPLLAGPEQQASGVAGGKRRSALATAPHTHARMLQSTGACACACVCVDGYVHCVDLLMCTSLLSEDACSPITLPWLVAPACCCSLSPRRCTARTNPRPRPGPCSPTCRRRRRHLPTRPGRCGGGQRLTIHDTVSAAGEGVEAEGAEKWGLG